MMRIFILLMFTWINFGILLAGQVWAQSSTAVEEAPSVPAEPNTPSGEPTPTLTDPDDEDARSAARARFQQLLQDAGLGLDDVQERTRLLLEVARLEREEQRINTEMERLVQERDRLRQERLRLLSEFSRFSDPRAVQRPGWLGVMMRDVEVMQRDVARMTQDLGGLRASAGRLRRDARINFSIAIAGIGDAGLVESLIQALRRCCNKASIAG